MSLVTVKNKFQVVIPLDIREQLGIKQGDILEAKVERGKLTYIPKTVLIIDRSEFPTADDEYTPEQRRAMDARLDEAAKGPFHGPFKSAEEVASFLDRWKRAPAGGTKRKTKKRK